MTAQSDLHFIVVFEDGSIWEDTIKRYWEMHPKTCDLVPTPFFVNTWMQGDDLMRLGKIKKSVVEWLELKGAKYKKIKFYSE